MPGFTYRVIDSDGRERKGNMNASTRAQVERRLSAEGLIIVDVDGDELLDDDSPFGRGTITNGDLSSFLSGLVRFLKAGIGTLNSLRMMADETGKRRMRNVINFLADQVSEGEPLYEAMNNASVFPDVLVACVEASEKQGRLIEGLTEMNDYYEKSLRRDELIKKSVYYPYMMGIVTLLIIIGTLIFVVPGFMGMIEDVDIKLPLSTRAVVLVSDFFSGHMWVLLVIAAVIIIASILSVKNRKVREWASSFRIKHPGMFRWHEMEDCAQFSRIMACLLKADVPLAKALELAGNSFKKHVVFKRSILRAKEYVSSGGALSKNLYVSPFLPVLFINMISIGEETGRLAEMFENAAEHYEEAFEEAVRKRMVVIEPVMVIVLAIVLGVIILALLRPLLALYEAVGNM